MDKVEFENVTLYHADCLDILPLLSGVDAVVSDPPYGMGWNTDFTRFSAGNSRRGVGRVHKAVIGDDAPFDPSPFLVFPECVLFGANHFWGELPNGGALIWLKRNDHALNTFLSDCEIAFIKGRKGCFAFRQTFSGSSKACDAGLDPYGPAAHPTQKPVSLMEWVLGYVKSQNIFDPYMGSGSTGVACMNTGRKFIGCEVDKEYFDIACKRISDAQQQLRLGI